MPWCDTLWVNDAPIGAYLKHHRIVYDVTDDWRMASLTDRELRRLAAAEDRLAVQAGTIVCSEELRRRWAERYGVSAGVVHNGVDVKAIRSARPWPLVGEAPHLGYVGTLHDDRLDTDLVLTVADQLEHGTVHLVGPDSLSPSSRARLDAHRRVMLHGAIPAAEVARWLVGFDVLICPHVVSSFTLSLDAIKSYEYLSSSLPIVATPTSGFQCLEAAGLIVIDAEGFGEAAVKACRNPTVYNRLVPDWDDRAAQFAQAIEVATKNGRATGSA